MTDNLRLIFFLFVVSLLQLACSESEPKTDIREFYFPISEMTEGKVYEYHCISDSKLAPEYWYFRTFESDTGTYFTGNFYDANFEVQQFFTEEVVSNGTLMYNYFLYARDSAGLQVQVPTEILVPNVFPFYVSDSTGIFLYKMRWNSGNGNEGTTTLIRNRRYMGSTNYSFSNQLYDCVEFDVRELVEVYDPVEGNIEPEYGGKELYAKGLGLVYYEDELPGGELLAYELKDIFPMEELLKKAAAKNNNKVQ